jgi:AcrR family transcriptional regulator
VTEATASRSVQDEQDVDAATGASADAPTWVHAPNIAPTVRGERTRQRIIEASEQLFRTASSYDNIGVADIARASRTSVGTIYRYFESKEDLLHLVLSNAFWRMYKASRGVWHKEDPAEVNIERTTSAYLEAFFEERTFLRLALRLISTSESVRDTWWSMRSELRERMRARLEQDLTLGTARPLDPEIAIRALLAMVDAYAAQAFIDEEFGPASKDEIASIASVLAQIWYRTVIGNDVPNGTSGGGMCADR